MMKIEARTGTALEARKTRVAQVVARLDRYSAVAGLAPSGQLGIHLHCEGSLGFVKDKPSTAVEREMEREDMDAAGLSAGLTAGVAGLAGSGLVCPEKTDQLFSEHSFPHGE